MFGILLLAGVCVGSIAAIQDVTARQARGALESGVRALQQTQRADGTWPDLGRYTGGTTALATLALLNAGVTRDDPRLSLAIKHISELENEYVYVVALKILALAEADAERYQPQIAQAAKWLEDAQQNNGLWSYTEARAPMDHSNTQFALLGLHGAAQVGVDINPVVWSRARDELGNTQNSDGGWGYRATDRSYGSMTAAGVADLLILGSSLVRPLESGFVNGRAPRCGQYTFDPKLLRAVRWLAENFRADQNPGRNRSQVFYWLYAVERCGILSGERYFGKHDWYRSGARFLSRAQFANGTWGDGVVDTSFGVLFLAKGRKPLLVQKLKWSDDKRWNLDRNDVAHLLSFIGDKLGEPVAWQVVDLDAPVEDWLAAPLLYFQGHEFPDFSPAQRAKLRRYVELGGTLFAEACCGREAFVTGFKRFAAEAFSEYPLRELPPTHPVYRTKYELKPQGLQGIDLGCRTRVYFSPRDVSCLWEQTDVPVLSEQAFRLGTNLAAYAAGRGALRERLDVVVLPAEEQRGVADVPGDTLRLTQVVHDGDWRPNPQALVNLAQYLNESIGLDVAPRYRTLRLSDEDLSRCPILFNVVCPGFELSAAERDKLRDYLRRGGFMFAEACCGQPESTAALRAEIAQLFPTAQLKPIPLTHPLFQGNPGYRIERVRYRESVVAEDPELTEPRLLGLEIDGRLALIYSPYSLGCGLEAIVDEGCRGYVNEDARRIAINIVLYALTR